MTDSAYSLLLFAGLIAGPVSAFMVNIMILPLFLIFPILGLAVKTGRIGTLKFLLLLVTAPVLSMVWGLYSGNHDLTERSLRWAAAVATGASMSGALGSSRASGLLHSTSRRIRMWGLLESLAMVISLAGPFSSKVRRIFIRSRKNGGSIGESFTMALSSVDEINLTDVETVGEAGLVSAIAAGFAWLIFLASIMGVL